MSASGEGPGSEKRPLPDDPGNEEARPTKKARIDGDDINGNGDAPQAESEESSFGSDDLEELEEDLEFAALSETEKFRRWLEEERDSGTSPLELFDAIGVPEIREVLALTSPDQLLTFWELLARQEDPIAMIQDLLEEAREIMHHRVKLPHINTKEDAIAAIKAAKKILVISGAGISVSCGVPDFRSPGGLYDQVSQKYKLEDPHLLFSVHYLRENPTPFFEFAKQLFPDSNLKPSPSHEFIAMLERRGQLLRHYTQNIDTLEEKAGITRSVRCHGSFATATCVGCGMKVPGETLRPAIMEGRIPYCTSCKTEFYKPDIVFFGEQLSDEFKEQIMKDCEESDLLIVMGSSLRVQPVAQIPRVIGTTEPSVPQLLFNLELVFEPHEFDYFFQGPCDDHVVEVMKALESESPK